MDSDEAKSLASEEEQGSHGWLPELAPSRPSASHEPKAGERACGEEVSDEARAPWAHAKIGSTFHKQNPGHVEQAGDKGKEKVHEGR